MGQRARARRAPASRRSAPTGRSAIGDTTAPTAGLGRPRPTTRRLVVRSHVSGSLATAARVASGSCGRGAEGGVRRAPPRRVEARVNARTSARGRRSRRARRREGRPSAPRPRPAALLLPDAEDAGDVLLVVQGLVGSPSRAARAPGCARRRASAAARTPGCSSVRCPPGDHLAAARGSSRRTAAAATRRRPRRPRPRRWLAPGRSAAGDVEARRAPSSAWSGSAGPPGPAGQRSHRHGSVDDRVLQPLAAVDRHQLDGRGVRVEPPGPLARDLDLPRPSALRSQVSSARQPRAAPRSRPGAAPGPTWRRSVSSRSPSTLREHPRASPAVTAASSTAATPRAVKQLGPVAERCCRPVGEVVALRSSSTAVQPKNDVSAALRTRDRSGGAARAPPAAAATRWQPASRTRCRCRRRRPARRARRASRHGAQVLVPVGDHRDVARLQLPPVVRRTGGAAAARCRAPRRVHVVADRRHPQRAAWPGAEGLVAHHPQPQRRAGAFEPARPVVRAARRAPRSRRRPARHRAGPPEARRAAPRRSASWCPASCGSAAVSAARRYVATSPPRNA